jgi:hypothetical protein
LTEHFEMGGIGVLAAEEWREDGRGSVKTGDLEDGGERCLLESGLYERWISRSERS